MENILTFGPVFSVDDGRHEVTVHAPLAFLEAVASDLPAYGERGFLRASDILEGDNLAIFSMSDGYSLYYLVVRVYVAVYFNLLKLKYGYDIFGHLWSKTSDELFNEAREWIDASGTAVINAQQFGKILLEVAKDATRKFLQQNLEICFQDTTVDITKIEGWKFLVIECWRIKRIDPEKYFGDLPTVQLEYFQNLLQAAKAVDWKNKAVKAKLLRTLEESLNLFTFDSTGAVKFEAILKEQKDEGYKAFTQVLDLCLGQAEAEIEKLQISTPAKA